MKYAYIDNESTQTAVVKCMKRKGQRGTIKESSTVFAAENKPSMSVGQSFRSQFKSNERSLF